MTEAEARAWVQASFDVPRETMARLDAFAALLRTESARQNLVSKASLDSLWLRHIADSAQLLRFAPSPAARWVDLGSGAGFPGLIVAALHAGPVTLIEERRLRVDFLHRAAESIGLAVEILPTKVERVATRPFDVISARAFAPLGRLLELGTALSTGKSRWVLPKGRNAQSELEALDPSWQGRFELHASVTDADARILVADGVHRAKGRRT
jgi:16S rRNA (guanine527-N7)-methyltransferase